MKIKFEPFCTALNFSRNTASFFYSSHITPLHSHNTLQLIIDLKGEFLFRTEHINWAKYTGVIIKENIRHQLNTNRSLQLIIYIDSLSALAQQIKDSYLLDGDFCSISTLFSPLEELLMHNNLIKPETKSIHLLLQLIFDRVNVVDGHFFSKRITQVLHLVKSTHPAELSIDYLASKVFISSSRLRMQFKQVLGISLHQYLVRHRILLAVTSMINGCNIQDAAHTSGFNDSSHLNKLMIKIFGVTPSMFLRTNSNFSVIRDRTSFDLITDLSTSV